MSGSLKLVGEVAITAEKLMLTLCKMLNKRKIPYVLEGGTLLGIIREQRLLPWDNDVDLTITEDSLEDILKLRKFIWLAGYRTRVRTNNKDQGPCKKNSVRLMKVQTRKYVITKGFNLLDIFVKTKSDGKYFWTVGRKDPVLKSVEAHFYENLTTINFKNTELSIPRDYEDYLTARYGDWRTPVKEWDFQKDDKALVNQKDKE